METAPAEEASAQMSEAPSSGSRELRASSTVICTYWRSRPKIESEKPPSLTCASTTCAMRRPEERQKPAATRPSSFSKAEGAKEAQQKRHVGRNPRQLKISADKVDHALSWRGWHLRERVDRDARVDDAGEQARVRNYGDQVVQANHPVARARIERAAWRSLGRQREAKPERNQRASSDRGGKADVGKQAPCCRGVVGGHVRASTPASHRAALAS
eukprot:53333-Prymnesium_polylepis.1